MWLVTNGRAFNGKFVVIEMGCVTRVGTIMMNRVFCCYLTEYLVMDILVCGLCDEQLPGLLICILSGMNMD